LRQRIPDMSTSLSCYGDIYTHQRNPRCLENRQNVNKLLINFETFYVPGVVVVSLFVLIVLGPFVAASLLVEDVFLGLAC